MTRDYKFDLRIAVWHHSIHGAPYRSDYMDVDQVYNMIGYGFRLGLHGHQHKHQTTPMHIHLPDKETMAIVSAGSLCAGAKELPTGFFRQYNIIEIADDLNSARVHVRQMETAHLFSGCHLTAAGGKTYVDVSWSPPPHGSSIRKKNDEPPPEVVLDAERMLARKQSLSGAQALLDWMPGLSGYGRSIFVQACLEAKKWDWLVSKLSEPQSIEELVALIEAYDRLRLPNDALSALAKFGEGLLVPAAQQRELEHRLRIRLGAPK